MPPPDHSHTGGSRREGISEFPRQARWGLCLALVALTFATGCQNFKTGCARVGKDILVLVASPVQIPAGGLRDAAIDVAREPWTGAPAAPLIAASHLIKHTYASVVYMIDLPWAPIHVLAGFGPIGIYDASGFPFEVQSEGLNTGAARATRSARILVTAPAPVVTNPVRSTGNYVQSHPWPQSLAVVPFQYPLSLVKNVSYVALHGVDYALSPLYMPFGPGPAQIYDWDAYPVRVTRAHNRTANRFYQAFGELLITPIAVPLRAGTDLVRFGRKHGAWVIPVAPFYGPVALVRHTWLGVSHGFVLLTHPLLMPSGDFGPFNLYLRDRATTNPIKERLVWNESIGGAKIVAGLALLVASALQQAQQQQASGAPQQGQDSMQELGVALILSSAKDIEAASKDMEVLADMLGQPGIYRPRTSRELFEWVAENASREELERRYVGGQQTVSSDEASDLVLDAHRKMEAIEFERDIAMARRIRSRIIARGVVFDLSVDRIAGSHTLSSELSGLLDHLLTAYHYPEKKDAYTGALSWIERLEEAQALDQHEMEMVGRMKSRLRKCRDAEYTDDGSNYVLRHMVADLAVYIIEKGQ